MITSPKEQIPTIDVALVTIEFMQNGQKKEIGFIGKHLHLIAVKDGEAVNILNKNWIQYVYTGSNKIVK